MTALPIYSISCEATCVPRLGYKVCALFYEASLLCVRVCTSQLEKLSSEAISAVLTSPWSLVHLNEASLFSYLVLYCPIGSSFYSRTATSFQLPKKGNAPGPVTPKGILSIAGQYYRVLQYLRNLFT